ncbi:MAG: OmpH family outer membrane protein [Pseudomonadota bacterium]
MRGAAALLALAVLAGVPPALAQDAAAPAESRPAAASPVLTLDQERLFAESAWGRRVQADIEKASLALIAENRRIEADLTAEEKSLTARRATLAPEAFRAEADAFDARVVAIRNERDAKARDLNRLRDAERKNFFAASIPIMGQMMQDRGAVAILDVRAIFLSVSAIDVTDQMIRRIDEVVGAGSPPPPETLPPPDPGPPQPGPLPPDPGHAGDGSSPQPLPGAPAGGGGGP